MVSFRNYVNPNKPHATAQINFTLQTHLLGLNVKADILLGLHAINLAVTVVGSATVMRKLRAIGRKLYSDVDRLCDIAED